MPPADMNDPFSLENLALFEQQTSEPARPPQVYVPEGRPLSNMLEEEILKDTPNWLEDPESQKDNYDNTKPAPEAFEFVIVRPRFRRLYLVATILLLILFILILVILILHFQLAKSSDARNNASAMHASSISEPMPSAIKTNTGMPVSTVSSTSSSIFDAPVVAVTMRSTMAPGSIKSSGEGSPTSQSNAPMTSMTSSSPIDISSPTTSVSEATKSPTQPDSTVKATPSIPPGIVEPFDGAAPDFQRKNTPSPSPSTTSTRSSASISSSRKSTTSTKLTPIPANPGGATLFTPSGETIPFTIAPGIFVPIDAAVATSQVKFPTLSAVPASEAEPTSSSSKRVVTPNTTRASSKATRTPRALIHASGWNGTMGFST